MKFTIEKQQNNKLQYLDLTINRVCANLKRKWYSYKKPMAFARLINHNSNHARTIITQAHKKQSFMIWVCGKCSDMYFGSLNLNPRSEFPHHVWTSP